MVTIKKYAYNNLKTIIILLMAFLLQSALVYYKFEIKPRKTIYQSEFITNNIQKPM
jgi:hypothetical protein